MWRCGRRSRGWRRAFVSHVPDPAEKATTCKCEHEDQFEEEWPADGPRLWGGCRQISVDRRRRRLCKTAAARIDSVWHTAAAFRAGPAERGRRGVHESTIGPANPQIQTQKGCPAWMVLFVKRELAAAIGAPRLKGRRRARCPANVGDLDRGREQNA